jgi:hypothetical protein
MEKSDVSMDVEKVKVEEISCLNVLIDENQSKIEQTNCKDLENKFVFVRVGNNDEPATCEQITQVKEELDRIFSENGINCLLFVTHHAVSIDIIEKKGV